MNRLQRIRVSIEAAFDPEQLEVIDEGNQHVGHAGARDGRGHFRVRIASQAFAGQLPIQVHRAIYVALGPLMQTDIHALAIEVLPVRKVGKSTS